MPSSLNLGSLGQMWSNMSPCRMWYCHLMVWIRWPYSSSSSFGARFALWMTVATLYLVSSLHGSSVSISNNNVPCPVEERSNMSISYCECNALSEIFCYHLETIPEFNRTGHVYSGIYMDKQKIKKVEGEVFLHLKVKKIVLNSNPIGDKISVNILTGLEEELEELHLGDCGIRTLPNNMLVQMHKLVVLHMWGNRIRQIPDMFFRYTKQLKELVLWGNSIGKLTKDSFAGLWELRKLDLDKNRINTLQSNMFRHLGKLEVLYLGENNINTLNSETFEHLVSLKALSLDSNGLAYVYPKAFVGLSNIKVLNLQNNLIDFVPDKLLMNMKNLTVLWLQHNKLQFLWNRLFEDLENVQEINLSHNKLDNLSDWLFLGCPELTHLMLDNNKLSTIKKCSLPRKARLKVLSLLGNPVKCNCEMTWIINNLVDKATSILGTCKNSHVGPVVYISDKRNYEGVHSCAAKC